jgi:carbon-monoxide dehydrogenase medium subunit
MPVIQGFEYFKPKTLNEALHLLSNNRGQASILAGGTDIVVQFKEDLITSKALIDIKGITELSKIEIKEDKLFIGACVTFTDLIESELIKNKFPIIWEASKTVGSVGIRNRATMVGNICSAVPSADSAPALLVYEALVILKNKDGERLVPISDWFIAPKKTGIQKDEIVVGILIHIPKKKYACCYEKLSRYEGEDLAQAGIGILAFEDHYYRIAFCAVGPIPTRAPKLEQFLNGKKITSPIIEEAKKILLEEITPITDIRSSRKYRIHMVKLMFERGLKKVISRLEGGKDA